MKFTESFKAAQLKVVVMTAEHYWNKAKKLFGSKIGEMPTLAMNARLTSTAGRAWLEKGHCDFSCYLMGKDVEYFRKNTIPHELAHHIAYRLYGDKGHGQAWKNVSFALFGDNNRCHTLETLHMAKQKADYRKAI